jgi:hypothetical protein
MALAVGTGEIARGDPSRSSAPDCQEIPSPEQEDFRNMVRLLFQKEN